MDFTVVIPAYNEEASIGNTIRQIRKNVPKAAVIIVDDGSSDKTAVNARKEKAKVISHNTNMGYGAALKTGISAAKTAYVGFLDADMTYNPSYFPSMMGYIKKENLDCVWGDRFKGSKNKMPLIRKFGNKMFVLLFWLVTGKNIGDCSSGQRILRKSAVKKLGMETLPDDLDFITALSKRIVSRGLKYKTIPINYEKREGRSKLGIIKHGFKMMKNIVLEK